MTRAAGILLPIFSLPSPYGIGTLGHEAYKFADFLAASGQTVWQVLPLGPTGCGDSPYQSFSSFAGNPYFIDIEMLIEDGLLTEEEADECDFGNEPRYIDYGKLYQNRFSLLEKAKERGLERDSEKVSAFLIENNSWLPDYALFMALKRHFGMKQWTEWEDADAKKHRSSALKKYRSLLKDDIELFVYIQFLFFEQWKRLKNYVNSLGISIIGDIPIYAALDSADCWADKNQFLLDADCRPVSVSGVPPDYFNAEGQLWGNPLYRWDRMKRNGFRWWMQRIEGAAKLYDIIRIDHFRGLESYWAVPYGEKTAVNGQWLKGPGSAFIKKLRKTFPDIQFIAEDLGYLTPEVIKLVQYSGFPGMKVLEFAFDSDSENPYLPHNYNTDCVCYTGTHDNPPAALWFEEIEEKTLAAAEKYLQLDEKEGYNWGLIRCGMDSPADLFIAQMQDYLNLGSGHRINTPGTDEGNWRWRMLDGETTIELAGRISEYTKAGGRKKAMPENSVGGSPE